MKYKKWSDEIWKQLRAALAEELRSGARPVAAFDADGTLWDADIGEDFFRYQIDQRFLPNLPPNPWEYYVNWKLSGDPRPAYLWLAQINRGVSLRQVLDWSEQAVASHEPLPIFADQKEWIQILLSEGAEIFVVTASVRWAMIPAAFRLGIDESHVLGVETKVENGTVTAEPYGFMTYREGKAEALLARTGGRCPFFASGNTVGDSALLRTASRLALAVRTNPTHQSEELIRTEGMLAEEAKERGWLVHEF
ncbi:MAG: haloacid dehalogenase [Bdellovibrio sp.]|nr:MAG: haloacid dehalogenase [Bdellovibrio sp.]